MFECLEQLGDWKSAALVLSRQIDESDNPDVGSMWKNQDLLVCYHFGFHRNSWYEKFIEVSEPVFDKFHAVQFKVDDVRGQGGLRAGTKKMEPGSRKERDS